METVKTTAELQEAESTLEQVLVDLQNFLYSKNRVLEEIEENLLYCNKFKNDNNAPESYLNLLEEVNNAVTGIKNTFQKTQEMLQKENYLKQRTEKRSILLNLIDEANMLFEAGFSYDKNELLLKGFELLSEETLAEIETYLPEEYEAAKDLKLELSLRLFKRGIAH